MRIKEKTKMNMNVGFTGTDKGMTTFQVPVIVKFLESNLKRIDRADHGDCIGSDKQFHDICVRLGLMSKIWIHPPVYRYKRAFCHVDDPSHVLPPREYLQRDDDMAKVCTIMLATPAEEEEITRSGTWATIRYAKKYGKQCYIVFPNGNVENYRPYPVVKHLDF
jgi:hypothetical protein